MAGSLNKVVLIGNVGRDPEVRNTNDGKEIVTLSLATTETWRDRSSGEKKEKQSGTVWLCLMKVSLILLKTMLKKAVKFL